MAVIQAHNKLTNVKYVFMFIPVKNDLVRKSIAFLLPCTVWVVNGPRFTKAAAQKVSFLDVCASILDVLQCTVASLQMYSCTIC